MRRKIANCVICLSLLAALLLGGCTPQKTADVTDKIKPDASQENTQKQDSESGTETGTETGKQDIDYPALELPGDDVKPIDWESGENPTGEQLKFASRTYDFSDEYYGNNIVLDGFGNSLKATDIHVRKIYDVMTGEIAYYSAYYRTYTPVENEYYTEYKIRQFSRIYSMEGDLLIDWEEVVFNSAIGDWILKSPYTDVNYSNTDNEWSGRLVNTKTGKVIDDVYGIERLDDTHIFANRDNGLFYILDKDGNITKDSDDYKQILPDATYCYSRDNYISVPSVEGGICDLYFFKADGSIIGFVRNVSEWYVYDEMTSIPYITIEHKIYDLSRGNGGELYPVCDSSEDHFAAYYDGSIAVYRDSDGADGFNDYLYNLSTKTQTSKTYKEIKTVDKYYLGDAKNDPIQYFYGISEDGIDKIDRDGNVVSHASVPNLYQINIYQYGIDCYYEDYESHYSYDLDLNQRDFGKYESVYPIYYYDGLESKYLDLYLGYYSLDANHSQTRYDILNSDFEPVVTGASRVGSVVDGTVPVTKGLSVGVMDFKGNWIMKFDKNDFTNAD